MAQKFYGKFKDLHLKFIKKFQITSKYLKFRFAVERFIPFAHAVFDFTVSLHFYIGYTCLAGQSRPGANFSIFRRSISLHRVAGNTCAVWFVCEPRSISSVTSRPTTCRRADLSRPIIERKQFINRPRAAIRSILRHCTILSFKNSTPRTWMQVLTQFSRFYASFTQEL